MVRDWKVQSTDIKGELIEGPVEYISHNNKIAFFKNISHGANYITFTFSGPVLCLLLYACVWIFLYHMSEELW